MVLEEMALHGHMLKIVFLLVFLVNGLCHVKLPLGNN